MSDTETTEENREVALAADSAPVKPGWDTSSMSDTQRAEADAILGRVVDRPNRPRITYEQREGDDGIALVVGGGSEASSTLHSMRFHDCSGSASYEFGTVLLRQLAEIVPRTGDLTQDGDRMTAAMAMIGGIGPENEMEAAMALQMVAAHEAALSGFKCARANARAPEIAATYSNMANKAMRSFALHAEALAKLRRNGEQVVKHVHVNEGGQAVIAGTVNTGGSR